MATNEFDWAKVVDYAKRETLDLPKTQYELPGVTQEMHQGVPVVVPPLWHAVVTAQCAFPRDDHQTLQITRERLNDALDEIESIYPVSPRGIFIQVGYGLPYFKQRLPGSITNDYMPKSTLPGTEGQWALIDSIKFPKDPEDVVLEQNDICFHVKSDFREHIENVIDVLFNPGEQILNGIPATRVYLGDLFTVTSIRRDFVGRNMPKLIGERLGIPGAEKIPAGAELFMGFTSSHLHGLADGNLSSFETIPGYTDQTPDSYFAHGTAMHLSHIAIDLEKWYAYGYRDRLHRMFHPRRTEEAEVLSPDQSPETSTFEEEREQDADQHHLVGHNEQMQFLSHVKEETTTRYGQKLPRGIVFFLRQDFDTVENPFSFWSNGPIASTPRAGVHFIGFGPSAQHFEKMRLEMDSVDLQQKYNLPDENVGFTKFLVTTHRQNFLLPPRAHRSFRLAEFL